MFPNWPLAICDNYLPRHPVSTEIQCRIISPLVPKKCPTFGEKGEAFDEKFEQYPFALSQQSNQTLTNSICTEKKSDFCFLGKYLKNKMTNKHQQKQNRIWMPLPKLLQTISKATPICRQTVKKLSSCCQLPAFTKQSKICSFLNISSNNINNAWVCTYLHQSNMYDNQVSTTSVS